MAVCGGAGWGGTRRGAGHGAGAARTASSGSLCIDGLVRPVSGGFSEGGPIRDLGSTLGRRSRAINQGRSGAATGLTSPCAHISPRWAVVRGCGRAVVRGRGRAVVRGAQAGRARTRRPRMFRAQPGTLGRSAQERCSHKSLVGLARSRAGPGWLGGRSGLGWGPGGPVGPGTSRGPARASWEDSASDQPLANTGVSVVSRILGPRTVVDHAAPRPSKRWAVDTASEVPT